MDLDEKRMRMPTTFHNIQPAPSAPRPVSITYLSVYNLLLRPKRLYISVHIGSQLKHPNKSVAAKKRFETARVKNLQINNVSFFYVLS